MAYQKLTPIIATGSTAPRYLGDRFADIVNVKDFGAVGDGVADDTAAFTAAQNSGAQAVMVPNGTYKITEDVAGTFFSFGEITTTGVGDIEIIDILSFDSIANQLSNNIQSKVALDGSNVSSIGATLSEYMAHVAMPSDRIVNLSFPASGGTVTAPADGYIYIAKHSTSALQFLDASSLSSSNAVCLKNSFVAPFNDSICRIWMPVYKGQKVLFTYNVDGAVEEFHFVYVNGAL